MANENSATGGRKAVDRDRSYGGGYNRDGRSIGSDRPDRNRINADFVTPKYGWDDASISDFSIIGGGLRGLFNTIASGDTYAGRTPQGFSVGMNRDNGGKSRDPYMGQVPGIDPMMLRMIQNGLYGGGSNQVKIQQAIRSPVLQQAPMAPPAPVQVPLGPMMTMAAKPLSVGGGQPYGVNIPSYQYRGPMG